VNKPLTSWPEVGLCLAKKIIESLLHGLERAWPAFDQTHQLRWHDDIRHFERIGLNRSLLQIPTSSYSSFLLKIATSVEIEPSRSITIVLAWKALLSSSKKIKRCETHWA
jgi:hypothetical protein